jgi:hypothetical protein
VGPDPELCVGHGKRRGGLFACPAIGCARPAGHPPPCSPIGGERRTTSAADVVSDERRELLAALRSLDAKQ